MYKIIITHFGVNKWVAVLKKKHWLWGWRNEEAITNEMPYTQSIIAWQKKYNIPDERIFII